MPVPRGGGNNTNDINNTGEGPWDWFRSLPIVTQYWVGTTLIITLAVNLKFLDVMKIVFIWDNIIHKFEIWRILTCFCFAGYFKGMECIIQLYLCYNYSKMYETNNPFNTGGGGGSADYLFMWILGGITMIVTQPLLAMVIPLGSYLYTSAMIYMVLYVWSKRHMDGQVSFWGIPVKAMHLPFVLAGFALFTGGDLFSILHGIFIGHVYYFMVDVAPRMYGKEFIQTPRFFIEKLGTGVFIPNAAPAAPQPSATNNRGWGGVNSLGTTSSGGGNNNTATTQRAGGTTQSTGRAYSWGGGNRLGSD